MTITSWITADAKVRKTGYKSPYRLFTPRQMRWSTSDTVLYHLKNWGYTHQFVFDAGWNETRRAGIDVMAALIEEGANLGEWTGMWVEWKAVVAFKDENAALRFRLMMNL